MDATRSFEERIERRLEALAAEVALLTRAERKREELGTEFAPILASVMRVATARLDGAEKKGYFAIGRELLAVLDRVVEGFSADDVRDLSRNVISILDTVRALTQPEVLSLLGDVSEAAENSDRLEPMGMLGLARASQDEDAQRGMAVLVEVLRRLGKGVKRAKQRERLEAAIGSRMAPRRSRVGAAATRARRTSSAPRASRTSEAPIGSTPAPASASKPLDTPPRSAEAPLVPGVEFTTEGFLANAEQWTPDLATRVAAHLGVELTAEHWKLVEFAREEYQRTGASPNIRRLTTGSGISTKRIYQLFPRAPGKCTAMIAGLPKPVGCI